MANERGSIKRRIVIGVSVVGFAALLVLGFIWWTTPPQMGADDEVFHAVDALFTAVTARDEKLLGQCEQNLCMLKDAGKLPMVASGYLDDVIRTARAGSWEPAAQRLYSFMRAQRREGIRSHEIKKRPQPGKQ